jgi:hypothetical protein
MFLSGTSFGIKDSECKQKPLLTKNFFFEKNKFCLGDEYITLVFQNIMFFFLRKKGPFFELLEEKVWQPPSLYLPCKFRNSFCFFIKICLFPDSFSSSLYTFLRRHNNPTQTKQFKESNEVFLLSKKNENNSGNFL